MMIELHSKRCSCGGGAWAVAGNLRSPCPGVMGVETAVITIAEWQSQGKPTNLEMLHPTAARGEFPRPEVRLRRS